MMALKLSLQTQIYRGKDKVLYPGIEKSKNDQTIRGSPMIKTRMSRMFLVLLLFLGLNSLWKDCVMRLGQHNKPDFVPAPH